MPMTRTYHDAASRWAGVGPYYAMFPVAFADEVVRTYTRPGEVVLDPFAGRGTAIFSAATQNRSAIGIEINPVGYVYAKAKLSPATRDEVDLRLDELGKRAAQFKEEAAHLPRFFHRCFSRRVRTFLLAARADLNWRRNRVDWTVMALLLVYLHGKRGAALSNQMRQTKSMSPQYAVRWWQAHDLKPPDVDPVAFVKDRLAWRYAKGLPEAQSGRMYLGDSVKKLLRVHREIEEGSLTRADLLFTSPPYHGITNYHYDQWLRLWLLGGPRTHSATVTGAAGSSRHARAIAASLISSSAGPRRCCKKMQPCTSGPTRESSRTLQPSRCCAECLLASTSLRSVARMLRPSQTRLFGKAGRPGEDNGEVDLILRPR